MTARAFCGETLGLTEGSADGTTGPVRRRLVS